MNTRSLSIENFKRNIQSCNEMIGLYEMIEKELPLLSERSKDILRSIIVLSVSALDTFLHDFYRTEIVESYLGNNLLTVDFQKVNVGMDLLKDLFDIDSIDDKRIILVKKLREIQKKDSYQSPKSIEYIFSNLGVSKIWSEIEKIGLLNLKANEIREELVQIIDRRNKISHESDWNYFTQQKYDITKDTSKAVVNFIDNFVESINKIAKNHVDTNQ